MGRGKRIEKVLSGMPEPTEHQAVVCVAGTPGGNLLQVVDASGHEFLCRVPSKFRGKVWVIKGGYLLVDMIQGDEDGEALGKVRANLAHHLYRDQIRHLQSRGKWPSGFETAPPTQSQEEPEQGDEYGALGDGDLPTNSNRRCLSDSEDDDDEEEDEEEEDDVEVDRSAPLPSALADTVQESTSAANALSIGDS